MKLKGVTAVTYLIVGNGPAGISALERIRQIDSQGKIIMVAAEDSPPYSRIMTPEYMTKEVTEDDLYIRGTDFYTKHGVEIRLGLKVERVMPESNQAVLENGERIDYDRLLIATGSRPLIPKWVDMGVEGVFTLWNKADAEKIYSYLPGVKETVIIGGGLVGLQAARALAAYGVKITVVEMANRLMPNQLDQTAGGMLKNTMETHGVRILLNTTAKSLVVKGNRVKGVELEDMRLNADMVLVVIGVRPNLDLVAETGIDTDKGLLVNSYLQTSISNIYAAGDIAQASGQICGDKVVRVLWPAAVQQGKVAGANMAGLYEEYAGSHSMNSIQLFGLSIISIGQIESGPGIEEVFLKYPSTGSYQKLLAHDNRLVGTVFAGDVQQAGILYHKLGHSLNAGYWGRLQVVGEEYIVA